MKTIRLKSLLTGVVLWGMVVSSWGQSDTTGTTKWTLNDCINYALKQNITVQQAGLSTQRDQLYSEQAKASRLPSLSASVNQKFDWNKKEDSQGNYGSMSGSNGTTYSVNSGVSLFNGFKIDNQIKQTQLNLQSSQYYTESVKESVQLNILDAFLQVLYARESVTNAEKQIETTTAQLNLAKERLDLSVISKSDYLQIKSELAKEKLTLANAMSQLSIANVNLEQLMELPVTDSFTIAAPDLSKTLNQQLQPNAGDVYTQALKIKPQIKEADLNTQSAQLDKKIAKADMALSLSLNAGIGTNYLSTITNYDYTSQLNNDLSPSVGLTLTIPIFQKREVKTNIGLAQIGIQNAQLEALNTKNQLRKDIEQAAVDVTSAQMQYEASMEQYQAAKESDEVAAEKFKNGLLNSVDYLYEKNNLITSESNLLQSKYKLIFNYKVLDFYKGKPITL